MEQEKSWTFNDFIDQPILLDKDKKGNAIGYATEDGYTLIGVLGVPAQTKWGLGHRQIWNIPTSGGLFHVQLYDTNGNLIYGSAKIVFRSADLHRRIPMYEASVRTMYMTSPTDRSKQQLVRFGENTPRILAGTDASVLLYFKPETDDTTINHLNTSNLIIIDYFEVKER